MIENREGNKANLFFKSYQSTIKRICQEEARKYAYRVRKHEKCLTMKDLMQESLMKVFLHADSYESSRAQNGVEGYIHYCAKSAIIDVLKRYGNLRDATFQEETSEYIIPDLLPHGSSILPIVDNDAFRTESQASVLLDQLHGEKRVMIEMKFGINFYCEHSDEDIAKEMGLSRPTVRKEINRALHDMKQYANLLNMGGVAA